MILNDHEYRVTKDRVERFRAAIARAQASSATATAHPRLHAAQIHFMRAQLEVLEQELRECEARRDEAPQIEHSAVDQVKTVTCPHCGCGVDTPWDEPWIITGQEQHAPQLVSFRCPYCEQQIRLDE